MISAPPRIDLLPEHLIDQIKAGEVIERPGNLLKEILENSVDAGSTKIELHIKNNGLDLISLKDNGHGMRMNDLPLAFSRHATSKISRFEDLYQLHSFGFRGEALASIASISRLQCLSKIAGDELGSEIRIEGGNTTFHGQKQISGLAHGTELVIQDLFHNTPARLKFVQSGPSEKTFIKKVIHAFILSHPGIEFQVKYDDAEKEIYPKADNLKARLEEMVPKSRDQLLFSERFYEDNEVEVYLIPGVIKTPVKWQNIFINDRYVLDKQLHRVMTNALFSAFGHDDFHYVVFFNLPPGSIDVNVHPNKTIIKCLESSKMISLLTSTIKELATGRHVPSPKAPMNSSPTFDFEKTQEHQTLLQERHDYNMEGVFSPHHLVSEKKDALIWLGAHFIKPTEDGYLAVAAVKLLDQFIKVKLSSTSLTIPLLVSEPYPAKNVTPERIQMLTIAGVEIEHLSSETLVLRGIPDWMNGFPLKEIMNSLLHGKALSHDIIRPSDWSASTWDEMLGSFSLSYLIENKIVADLSLMLREKLK